MWGGGLPVTLKALFTISARRRAVIFYATRSPRGKTAKAN